MEKIVSFGGLKSMTYDEPNLTIEYEDMFKNDQKAKLNLSNFANVKHLISIVGDNKEFCDEFKNKVEIKDKSMKTFGAIILNLKEKGEFNKEPYKNERLTKILKEKFDDAGPKYQGNRYDVEGLDVADVKRLNEGKKMADKPIKPDEVTRKSLDNFLKIQCTNSPKFVKDCLSRFGDIRKSIAEYFGCLTNQYPKTCKVILCKGIEDFFNKAREDKIFSSEKEFSIDEKILNFFKIKEVAKLMKGKIGIFYNVIWENGHAKILKQAYDVAKKLNSRQSKNPLPVNQNLAPNKPSIEFKELDFKCISEFLDRYKDIKKSTVFSMIQKYYNAIITLTKGKNQMDNKVYNYTTNLNVLISCFKKINNIKNQNLLEGIDEFIKGL